MAEKITLTEFKKLFVIVQSRAFGLDVDNEEVSCLVPYADMLNHDLQNHQVKWYFDQKSNGFIVEAFKDIKPNE